jgi:hypothetical protein
MAFDRSDYHFDDAGSEEAACRHIMLFLLWAAERGLASPETDVVALRADPSGYFDSHCDGKLTDHEFNERGAAFAQSAYDAYLSEVNAYAQALGVSDYEIPANSTTQDHFFAWLDARHRSFSEQRSG